MMNASKTRKRETSHNFFRNFIFMSLTVILSIVLLDIGLRVLFFSSAFIKNSDKRDGKQLQIGAKIAYGDDAAWVDDYFREKKRAENWQFDPYVVWRQLAFQGKYITISEQGVRKTWNSSSALNSKKKIFCLGGSVMWGMVSRDEFTIPSYISKELARAGFQDYQVVNLGQEGYTATQELMTLIIRLKQNDIPEYVVFFSGINDAWSAYQPGSEVGSVIYLSEFRESLRMHRQSEDNRFYDFFYWGIVKKSGLLRAFEYCGRMRKKTAMSDAGRGKQKQKQWRILAEQVLDDYFRTYAVVEKLSQVYGFKFVYFWQPNIVCGKQLTAQEKRILAQQEKDLVEYMSYLDAGLQARRDISENFSNLSRVFVSEKETIYADFCHFTEKGNRLIAGQIVDRIKGQLVP